MPSPTQRQLVARALTVIALAFGIADASLASQDKPSLTLTVSTSVSTTTSCPIETP